MPFQKLFLPLFFTFLSIVLKAQPSGPKADFERLWQQFDRNYALFDIKKVDWQAAKTEYQNRVSDTTSRDDLAKIFASMLAPLHDGHVSILDRKAEKVVFKSQPLRDSFNLLFKSREDEFWKIADQNLIENGFEKLQSVGPLAGKRQVAPIYFSKTSDGRFGYVRLTRMFFEQKGVFGNLLQAAFDLRKLRKAFAEQIKNFEKCDGLIVDLRSNGGGHSGYELARHFADERRLANLKRTKKAAGFGDFQSFFVKKARKRSRFLKKTIVLTSDKTGSAAEDFALAAAVCPSVELFGQATRGMMSDIFSFKLEWSGWSVQLSNQLYFSTEKVVLEERGVLPDRVFPIDFSAFEKGHDPLILAAMEVLKKGR